MGDLMGEPLVGRAFIVAGRVQGVGFRWFVRDLAQRHQVSGWVANQSDGTVRGEAAGTAEAVAAFIAAVGTGPPGAYVARIQVTEIAPTVPSTTFEIRR
jgi:acylphosphatase